MAERDDDQERSLPASERRLEQAREEGRVARSRELPAFLLVLLGAGALWGAGDLMVAGFAQFVRGALEFGAADAFDRGRVAARLAETALQGLLLAAPLLGASFVIALAAPVAVGGWVFSTQAVAPDLTRLDPLGGLRRMFSPHGLGELAKALGKAGLIAAVAGGLLWSQRGEFAALLAQPFQSATSGALALLGRDALLCVLAFGLVAAADVPFALWQHRRDLRMTLQELRREHRETEGDPQLKARVRSLQRDAARRRMMQEVPKASVVVTNPTHTAVALAYREGGMGAPRVVAKGQALVAQRIRELAQQHGVPLVEAPPLARALHRHVDLGAHVPPALFTAVAQVLAYVYQLRAARATGARPPLPPAAVDVPPGMDPGLAGA